MPDGSTSQRKRSDKQAENKFLAPQLRSSARAAAKEMFASGDLREYLKILKHMHTYDAYNIMLILQQYPRATCLAGYKIWQRMLSDPKKLVLKPEWRGKGIDLVIPFTDIITYKEQHLIWYAVKQFDISQTNAAYTPTPSVYISDDAHMQLLIKSVCHVIETIYSCNIYHSACDPAMKASGLIGRFTEQQILIRDDAAFPSQLQWLADCLCTLHGAAENLPSACRPIHHQCVIYALWNAWSLDRPPSLYAYRNRIRTISDDVQMPLLEAIRNAFRTLEGFIASTYLQCREEKAIEDSLKEIDEEIWSNELKPPI